MNQMVNTMSLSRAKSLGKVLGELAVVAYVNAKALGTSRLDKTASIESDATHGARQGTARTNVNRLPGAEAEMNAIKACQRRGRECLKYWTSPWQADKRLLPNVSIQQFVEAFTAIDAEHKALVEQFVDKADRLIARAQANLGTYSVAPPTHDEIANGFSLSFTFHPVPQTQQYKDSVMDKQLQRRMADDYEADLQTAYRQAQKDAILKVWEPLGALMDRMEQYEDRLERIDAGDDDVGKTGTFKSTVISNITDMAKVFRSLNLTGDQMLDGIANRLDAFEQYSHKELTKSEKARAAITDEAASIRKLLEELL